MGKDRMMLELIKDDLTYLNEKLEWVFEVAGYKKKNKKEE